MELLACACMRMSLMAHHMCMCQQQHASMLLVDSWCPQMPLACLLDSMMLIHAAGMQYAVHSPHSDSLKSPFDYLEAGCHGRLWRHFQPARMAAFSPYLFTTLDFRETETHLACGRTTGASREERDTGNHAMRSPSLRSSRHTLPCLHRRAAMLTTTCLSMCIG